MLMEFQSQARSQPSGDIAKERPSFPGMQFQSQARSQPSGDKLLAKNKTSTRLFQSQARSQPSGDALVKLERSGNSSFQSQARSQPSGDAKRPICNHLDKPSFNLKREANPLATANNQLRMVIEQCGFNLKREANPLATKEAKSMSDLASLFQSQARSQPSGDCSRCRKLATHEGVSISSEKPTLWRLKGKPAWHAVSQVSISSEKPTLWRPSQSDPVRLGLCDVSISSEKPTLWRQTGKLSASAAVKCFNLKREANPLATHTSHVAMRLRYVMFQSQARSQPSGDSANISLCVNNAMVSISSEKPTLWRRNATR